MYAVIGFGTPLMIGKVDSVQDNYYRATARDVRATARDVITHTNQCKFHVNSLLHGKQDSRTNVCHTRATVTVLPKLLYMWMPFHLVYSIAMLVCENFEDSPTK